MQCWGAIPDFESFIQPFQVGIYSFTCHAQLSTITTLNAQFMWNYIEFDGSLSCTHKIVCFRQFHRVSKIPKVSDSAQSFSRTRFHPNSKRFETGTDSASCVCMVRLSVQTRLNRQALCNQVKLGRFGSPLV